MSPWHEEWHLASRVRGGYQGRGWTLEVWEHVLPVSQFPVSVMSYRQAARYLLSQLEVTPGQAQAIAATRRPGTPSPDWRWDYGMAGSARIVLDSLELTPAEASGILDGRDPLNVLLPRIWARSLTLEELMSA